MIVIAKTIKNIDMLIKKAEHFIDEAIETKEEYPTLAEAHYETYKCLINSIDVLHSEVVRFINQQSENSKIDEKILQTMKNVWSFEHTQYLDKIEYLEKKEEKYKKF